MKVKTSVTLSEELLRDIDRSVAGGRSRSQFIERAVSDYIRRRERDARRTREIELLNAIADGTLGEPPDVEDYSAEVGDEIEL